MLQGLLLPNRSILTACGPSICRSLAHLLKPKNHGTLTGKLVHQPHLRPCLCSITADHLSDIHLPFIQALVLLRSWSISSLGTSIWPSSSGNWGVGQNSRSPATSNEPAKLLDQITNFSLALSKTCKAALEKDYLLRKTCYGRKCWLLARPKHPDLHCISMKFL